MAPYIEAINSQPFSSFIVSRIKLHSIITSFQQLSLLMWRVASDVSMFSDAHHFIFYIVTSYAVW